MIFLILHHVVNNMAPILIILYIYRPKTATSASLKDEDYLRSSEMELDLKYG